MIVGGVYLRMVFEPYVVSDAYPAALIAIILGALAVVIVVGIIIYVYSALALMAIAKKTKTEPAYLAWIPIANYYLMSKIAKMHWWPILLIVGFWIPFLGWIATLLLWIFTIIWWYKIFEAVKRPGWWALLVIIPFIGWLIFFILLGVAAWSKK